MTNGAAPGARACHPKTGPFINLFHVKQTEKGENSMTLMDRLALIRAGYKASEIREMEKEGTEPHEPQQMEPGNGLEQQQDAAAGTQGTDPSPAAQDEDPGENPDADPRDERIAELTRQLEAARRANIDQNNGKPYGDDEYIRDVFNRTH